MVSRPSGTMWSMRKFAALTLCIAVLAVACGPGEAEPEEARDVTGKSPAEIEAKFNNIRQGQQEVLSATADVVARAETASVEELEKGMKELNLVLLRALQESSYMRSLRTEEGKSRMNELRASNLLIREAYAKLMDQHPNPTPDLMRAGDAPTQ